jgi:threonine dehydratase
MTKMTTFITKENYPTLENFREAAERVKDVAVRTPLVSLRYYNENPEILLKPEILQPIGSYKIRGVYNWAVNLPPDKRAQGISTISSGNMAQGIGYVGKLLQVPAKVATYHDAPKNKIDSIKKYGVEIIYIQRDGVWDYYNSLPEDHCFLHGLAEYYLVEGHGTIGLEIMEDAPDTETIFVPVGAGLLATGVSLAAKAIKPSVKIIGVQTERNPLYYESIRQGKALSLEHKSSLADGISGNVVTDESVQMVGDNLDDIVLVSEKQLVEALRYLALENKMVVEGAGAAGLAAALQIPKKERGKTVCILSGGSIDPEKFYKIIANQYTP